MQPVTFGRDVVLCSFKSHLPTPKSLQNLAVLTLATQMEWWTDMGHSFYWVGFYLCMCAHISCPPTHCSVSVEVAWCALNRV